MSHFWGAKMNKRAVWEEQSWTDEMADDFCRKYCDAN